MFATNAGTDFRSMFPYQSLTKIHGKPMFMGIRKIDKELTANAASIPSDLGGGAHGHLGLVKSAADYAKVSPTAYTIPTLPPPMTIPHGVAHHEAFRIQQEHMASTKKFHDVQTLQKLLLQQLQAAIDREWLQEYFDPITFTITQPIAQVLKQLYRKYGKVKREDLKAMEKEVENIAYDIQQPLSTVWTAIRELESTAKAADSPYTDRQLIDFALDIIKRTHDFEEALSKWYQLPTPGKTYKNLTKHFDSHYKILEEVRGDNMQQNSFQQANLMRAEMLSDINNMKDDIIQAMEIAQQSKSEPEQPVETMHNTVQIDMMEFTANVLKDVGFEAEHV